MRPITRPKGNYAEATFTRTLLVGKTKSVECLAICLLFEISRLKQIIGTSGHPFSIANAIKNRVVAAAHPVLIPNLAIPQIPSVFAGGTFAEAIEKVPINDRNLVESYCRYLILFKNLDFNVGNASFSFLRAPKMVVADMPYAVSCMQDVRQLLGIAAASVPTSRLYSKANNTALIGIPSNAVRSYRPQDLNRLLKILYSYAESAATGRISPYAGAAAELVNFLGPYCVYCEAKLKIQIDVEHLLPKGKNIKGHALPQGFSSFSQQWDNFLPACPRCNSTKNARPSKLDISNLAHTAMRSFVKREKSSIGLIRNFNNNNDGDYRVNDLEYASLYQDYIQFPLESISYQNLGFALVREQGTSFVIDNTSFSTQLNWTIASVNDIKKVVTMNVGGGAQRNYRVLVDPGTIGASLVGTAVAARVKVANIVKICGLNSTQAATDRRLLERTETWFMTLIALKQISNALAALTALAGTISPAVYTLVYNNWKADVIRTMKEKGFLSVWLKIFSKATHPLTNTPASVPKFPSPLPASGSVRGAVAGTTMTLVQDIATSIMNTTYFPNTNFSQVP